LTYFKPVLEQTASRAFLSPEDGPNAHPIAGANAAQSNAKAAITLVMWRRWKVQFMAQF
jgi:hypothetical protein